MEPPECVGDHKSPPISRSLAHLLESDIERVSNPEKMLNDEVINSYLSLLTMHFAGDKAVYLRTQFWTSYASNGYDQRFSGRFGNADKAIRF
jgi:Ulp1 family protease